MSNTVKKVNDWYKGNVNTKELEDKVKATLSYVKRFNEPDEDNEWNIFAQELVSGAHGQYTMQLFVEEVAGVIDYDQMDIDGKVSIYNEVSTLLANVYNKHSVLPGYFYISHNEADGSLGVFYSENA